MVGLVGIAAMALLFSACSEDSNAQGRTLGDVGVDAIADTSTTNFDAESDGVSDVADEPDGHNAADAASDTGQQSDDVREDVVAADAQADQGANDVDVDTGGAAPRGCTDDDGACPSGCYVTTDNDCTLSCRDPGTWPPAWKAYEDEVLRLSNLQRASGANCGGTNYPPVPALTMNAQLREAARCHSLDMSVNDFFSHFGSDGSSPVDRITASGYRWSDLGENVAGGAPDPSVVVPGWMNSPGHCRGIMSADFTEIGVGYVYEAQDTFRNYNHYWTQAFGHPR